MKPRTLKKFRIDYEAIEEATSVEEIEQIVKEDFTKLLLLWLDYYEEMSAKYVFNIKLEEKAYYFREFLEEFLGEKDLKIPQFTPHPPLE